MIRHNTDIDYEAYKAERYAVLMKSAGSERQVMIMKSVESER